MPKRFNTLGEGHYRTDFIATVSDVIAGEIKGIDGRPVREWFQVGELEQHIKYNGTLEIRDGTWVLLLEWIDATGTGHRVVLPHDVLMKMFDAESRLKFQLRKARGMASALTRKENAKAKSLADETSDEEEE